VKPLALSAYLPVSWIYGITFHLQINDLQATSTGTEMLLSTKTENVAENEIKLLKRAFNTVIKAHLLGPKLPESSLRFKIEEYQA